MVALALAIGTVAARPDRAPRAARAPSSSRSVIGSLGVAPRLTRADLDAAAAAGRARRSSTRRCAGSSDDGDRLCARQRLRPDGRHRLLRRPRADRRGRARRTSCASALGGRLVSDVEREHDDAATDAERRSRSTCRCGSAGGAPGRRRARALPRLRADRRRDPRRTRARSTCCSAVGLGAALALLFTLVGRASRRLRHQALHDTLTGLPNRSALYRARRARDRAACGRAAARSALLLIDLDRFKEVNDTLGHDLGDGCCARSPSGCAARCGAATRSPGSAATSSPCCCRPARPRRRGRARAAGLLDALERPFVVARRRRRLEASIGVALCPEHGDDVDDAPPARRRRDVRGQARARAASRRLRRRRATRTRPTRLRCSASCARALDGDELVLHYQPKVARRRRRASPASRRWCAGSTREHGLLAPDEFIPLAERTGLIGRPHALGARRGAAASARAWQDAGHRRAGRGQPRRREPPRRRRCRTWSAELLARTACPASGSSCEITEHTVMADPRRANEVAAPAARARRAALARRLRHRLLVARLPQAAAGRRAQDRPRRSSPGWRRRRRRA